MKSISVVFCGPKYYEYNLNFAAKHMRKIFPGCEVILATNDPSLYKQHKTDDNFDASILVDDAGPLPGIKFSAPGDLNNINRQVTCTLEGVKAASHELVLKLRTDQLLIDDSILSLWEISEKYPPLDGGHRIITSSIFTINPRFNERMPYHISDMMQFGRKEDIVKYYTVPEFPFEHSVWYENHSHRDGSTIYEKEFRTKYAVEQWLALHYFFGSENNFPVKFHNDLDEVKLLEFEKKLAEGFIVGHPDDLGLRPAKFYRLRSYYDTQCYSTKESLALIERALGQKIPEAESFSHKGIDKNKFETINKFQRMGVVRWLWWHTPMRIRNYIKNKFF